ncbi:MAG TPA: DedA family protein [Candidatus Acidoferrum sp.]|nr:DedA family protein [Candidatus Acidoferrum sp.]
MLLTITSSITSLFHASYATISAMMSAYGYPAIFGLMLLDGASLPIVPSEVVLPLAGLLAQQGVLNFVIAFIAAFAGTTGGMVIDYYIGYLLGKQVVYKHLKLFHVKQESLDRFDDWFAKNGVAAVFIARLIPLVGALMSFPAGFAKMNPKKFFPFAMAGAFIWTMVLMLFGYFFLSAKGAVYVITAIGVFAIVVYFIYYTFTKRIANHKIR